MTPLSNPRLKHRVFGINHYICPDDVGLLDFLDTAAAHGFAGVGLTERALKEIPLAVLKHELAARDLGVTSVNSIRYVLNGDPEAARRQAERHRWLIDCSSELRAAAVNVIVGGLSEAGGAWTLETMRHRAGDALIGIHRRMVEADLRMVVEPMHPFSLWTKSCFNSLRQVQEAIRGMSHAAVNVDLYHVWWDPDLIAFIACGDSAFGMFQICDAGNFEIDGMARRIPLGEGVVDFSPLLKASLRRVRPPIVEVELFASQLAGRTLAELLNSTVLYLNAQETTR